MKFRIVLLTIVAATFANLANGQTESPNPEGVAEPQLPAPATVPGVTANNAYVPSQQPSAPAWQANAPTIFASLDYSLNWLTRSSFPPLVTASPPGVALANAGVLGQSTTSVAFGGKAFDRDPIHGVRFRVGAVTDDGVTSEISAFCIRGTQSVAFSGGNGSLARPFFEPFTEQEAANFISFPNRFDGSIVLNHRTDFWGIEANVFDLFHPSSNFSIGGGARYLDLSEELHIHQETVTLNAPPLFFLGSPIPLSEQIRVWDSFAAQNKFLGANLVVRFAQSFGPLSLTATAKLAAGINSQSLMLTGQSNRVASNGQTVDTAPAGFLVAFSNHGPEGRKQFSVIPEFNLNLEYRVFDNLKFFVGYDIMCWTNVLRPADHIDRTVNLTQVPTAAIFNGGTEPLNIYPRFENTHLLVNSVRFGIEISY
jgi:hypothetical protein